MTQEPEVDLSQTIRQILGVLIRRRWLIGGTACAVLLATIAASARLPNRYTSEATIVAVQQQVPERYVASTTTSDTGQVLEALVQEAFSRTRLLRLIDEANLYPKLRTKLKPEELVEKARSEVSIEPLENKLGGRDLTAFKISCVADTPQQAQAFASSLTTLIVEQNLKSRSDQATTTTRFLQEQLTTAKTGLDVQEERLREFKTMYLGELPEQQQGNLAILAGLHTQLDSVMANRSRAQQQRLYLESLISEYQRRERRAAAGGITVTGAGQAVTPLQAAEKDLRRMQSERQALLLLYTPRHPEVVHKEKEIAAQQSTFASLRAQATASDTSSISSAPPEVALLTRPEEDPVVAQMRSQLQANRMEIDDNEVKEKELRVEIGTYQKRLSLTPMREQQLSSLQRDYELLRQHYGDLLKKQQQSQLAADLEKRQEGQQFRLADPANLPTLPSSPKRLKFSFLGGAAGILVAGALALLAEVRDSSFRAESDVRRRLSIPLVVGIPSLLTPADLRKQLWTRVFEWAFGIALLLSVFAAEIYVYRQG